MFSIFNYTIIAVFLLKIIYSLMLIKLLLTIVFSFTFALIRTLGECLIKVPSANTIFLGKCLVNSFLSCAS